jgi:hypothetical protein
MPHSTPRLVLAASLGWAGLASTLGAAGPQLGGGGSGPTPGRDQPSDAFYLRVEHEIERNLAELRALGIETTPPLALADTEFAWPLRSVGLGNFHYHGTSNFVDQDPDASELLDYFCTARTYDGHRGTDFFTWPFGFLLMDDSRVEVVAAAAGTIAAKDDGNFDRRCACDTDDPNYVILQHAGYRSWYLHMKNGSVTTKGIGETVAAGEYLGIVGSSGCSTGPHLHFEVDDPSAAPDDLFDPYDGACNALNPGTLWSSQPTYREPAINRLTTGDALPSFPACPTQEVPNERRLFEAAETIYLVVYLRDEDPGLPKNLKTIRPDGSTQYDWEHTTPSVFNSSYWYWFWEVEDVAGRWLFQVTFDGVVYERAYWVGALFADDFEENNVEAWSSAVTP